MSDRCTLTFRAAGAVQETHGRPIYCVSWSQTCSKDEDGGDISYLASCAGNVVTIYAQNDDGLTPIQCYTDSDKAEDYYCCVFGGRSVALGDEALQRDGPSTAEHNEEDTTIRSPNKKRRLTRTKIQREMLGPCTTGPPLLCVAGKQRTIKVIDTDRQMLLRCLTGSGGDIYDLKTCPTDEWVLLSAATDESFRMWNLKNGTCVAIFGGHECHKDSIISVAWHPLGTRIASAGIDATIKLWDVSCGSVLQQAMAKSHKAAKVQYRSGYERQYPPVIVHFPIFSTDKVHTQCIDCVQFVGDLILSKSVESTVVLWSPMLSEKSKHPPPSDIVALRTFQFDHGDLWYLRFDTDPLGKTLAVGNTEGQVYVWDIGGRSKKPISVLSLPRQEMSIVRWVAFSPDGKVLVVSTDDGAIWKWNIEEIVPKEDVGLSNTGSSEQLLLPGIP